MFIIYTALSRVNLETFKLNCGVYLESATCHQLINAITSTAILQDIAGVRCRRKLFYNNCYMARGLKLHVC